MRALFVTTIAETIQAFLLPLAASLRDRGWEVEAAAATHKWSDALKDHFDALHQMPWSRRPEDVVGHYRGIREIQRTIQSGDYDVVHVHTPIASFLTRIALLRRDRWATRLLYTAHGFHFELTPKTVKGLPFLAAEKFAARRTDMLVVINDTDLQAATKLRLAPSTSIAYIPGIGVDLTAYRRDLVSVEQADRFLRDARLDRSHQIIAAIGELSRNKNHGDLIRAFAQVKDRDTVLAIAGEGPLEDSLRHLAEALGVADRVRLLGRLRDVRPLLHASTVFVMPSLREGLPRSVMEAMAMGVPVIGTDIRGTRDLLANGAGRLVPPRSVAELRHALELLLGSEACRRDMTERGLERIKEYALESVTERYLEIYERLAPQFAAL
jgi:glycosyltransferase involved in cell wall biosynthesis